MVFFRRLWVSLPATEGDTTRGFTSESPSPVVGPCASPTTVPTICIIPSTAARFMTTSLHDSSTRDLTPSQEARVRERVLVVDDEQEIRSTLHHMLEGMQWEVIEATSGEDALERAVAEQPDIILLDIRMPGLNGIDVCRMLKERTETRHIPVLLMSGYSAVNDWVAGLEAGAADYLPKPIRRPELQNRVATQLALNKARRACERQEEEIRRSEAMLKAEMAHRHAVEESLHRNLDALRQSHEATMDALEYLAHAEKAASESDAQFRLLVENTPDAIFVQTEEKFAFVNEAAVRLFGARDASDLLGHSVYGFFHADDRDLVRDRVRQLNIERRGVPLVRERFLRVDGSVRVGEVSSIPFTYDGRDGALVFIRDITQRLHIEQELREHEDIFRHVFEAANVGKSITMPTGEINVNQAFCDMLGYSRNELRNRTWQDLTPPEDIPTVASELAPLLAGERSSTRFIKRYRHKSGDDVWTDVSVTLRRSSDGVPLHFITTVVDITEQIRAREAERESEAFFKESQRAANIGSYKLDIGTGIWESSEVLDGIFGIDENFPRTVEGWLALVHPDDRAMMEDHFLNEVVQQRQPFNREYRITRQVNGGVRWVLGLGQLLFDEQGRLVVMRGTIQDITDRKSVEEAMLLDEARMESLLRINQFQASSVQELLDYALDEAIALTGSTIGYIYFYNEETREFTLNTWSRDVMEQCRVADPQRLYHLENTGLWGEAVRQRRPIMVQDYAAPNPWKRGQPDGHAPLHTFLTIPVIQEEHIVAVVGVANKSGDYDDADIRQLQLMMDAVWKVVMQRWAQEEVQRLNAELEKRVERRTTELATAVRELEAFSYSVSHDLRAPLRGVDGLVHMLMEDYGPLFDNEGRRLCMRISESARKMGRLIDDLLSFSRIGRSPLQRLQVDMRALARGTWMDLTTEDQRELIDFVLEDIPATLGDPSMLRQVWINLISNAIKFTSKMENPVIRISAGRSDEGVDYRIEDNGAGFDPQYADRMFGVFERLHSAVDFDGTGMGLAIVQRVVERHGGRITAHGDIGRGAVFTFTLPLPPEPPAQG